MRWWVGWKGGCGSGSRFLPPAQPLAIPLPPLQLPPPNPSPLSPGALHADLPRPPPRHHRAVAGHPAHPRGTAGRAEHRHPSPHRPHAGARHPAGLHPSRPDRPGPLRQRPELRDARPHEPGRGPLRDPALDRAFDAGAGRRGDAAPRDARDPGAHRSPLAPGHLRPVRPPLLLAQRACLHRCGAAGRHLHQRSHVVPRWHPARFSGTP